MRIKRLLFLLAALTISLPLFSQEYVGDSCTALLVGKKASSEWGSRGAWARWETQVGKVDNHPHLLAHVILITPPSKATSPGKVVPLKSHLAR